MSFLVNIGHFSRIFIITNLFAYEKTVEYLCQQSETLLCFFGYPFFLFLQISFSSQFSHKGFCALQ